MKNKMLNFIENKITRKEMVDIKGGWVRCTGSWTNGNSTLFSTVNCGFLSVVECMNRVNSKVGATYPADSYNCRLV